MTGNTLFCLKKGQCHVHGWNLSIVLLKGINHFPVLDMDITKATDLTASLIFTEILDHELPSACSWNFKLLGEHHSLWN